MTWTYNKYGIAAVVSAENCEMACLKLARQILDEFKETIIIKNEDLIPVVTSTRWVRILRWDRIWND